MTEENEDTMVKKALKAMAQEDLEKFIDCKNISDEDLKKALLTAVDIDILLSELHTSQKTPEKIKIKEEIK